MALQKQVYRLNFGQGLDTKTDPKTLSSGKMIVLQNARFQIGNRLSKRNGFSAVGVADANSGDLISRLTSVDSNVIGFGDQTGQATRALWGMNNSITVPTYAAVAPSYNDCTVSTTLALSVGSKNIFTGDMASANGYSLYVGMSGTTSGTSSAAQSMYISKDATGVVVVALTAAGGSGLMSKALACGNSLVLVNYIGTTVQISSWDTANAFARTNRTLTTALATPTLTVPAFDACSYTVSGTTTFVVAYQAAATMVTFVRLNPDATVVNSLAYTASMTIGAIGWISPCPSTTSTTFRAVLGGSTITTTQLVPFNTSLTIGTVTTNALPLNNCPDIIIGQENSDGTCRVFTCSHTSPNPSVALETSTINTSGTWSVLGVARTGLGIASKVIYRSDNDWYFWTIFPSAVQSQYCLVHSISSQTVSAGFLVPSGIGGVLYPAARTLAGEAYGYTNASATFTGGLAGHAANITLTGSTKYVCALPRVCQQFTDSTTTSFVQLGGMQKVTSDFSFTNLYRSAAINNQTVMGGGFLTLHDGRSLSELGFWQYPELGAPSGAFNATASMSQGLYQYVAVYEWYDAKGILHQSETSVPVSVTLSGTQNKVLFAAGNSGNVLSLKGVVLGNVNNQIQTVYYRTTVNASPPIFYRLSSANDFSADTTITADSILYTNGGVLDNFTIDGTSVICAGPDRLYAADPNDDTIVHIGKLATPTNGLSFFSGLNIVLPSGDGPVTNMQYLDTSLVIFKARVIYVVQGQGPTNNGQNNGLSPPQKISGDVGCDGPHTATIFPGGILFKSAKGYFVLGRDFSFSPDTNYIGAGVETFNSSSCLRAMTREDLNECRFLLSDNATILVYNYFFKQWSTIQTSATDMTEVNGTFYLSSNTPSVGALIGQETVGTFTDALLNPTGIPFNIQTGWCALNQLQGCQRIYRVRFLGDSKSTHTLTVSFAYDYEGGDTPTFSESHTITSANATAGSSNWQCEAFPLRQKCEAIAIKISDGTPTGESFDLTDIELEVGVMPGRRFPLSWTKNMS